MIPPFAACGNPSRLNTQGIDGLTMSDGFADKFFAIDVPAHAVTLTWADPGRTMEGERGAMPQNPG